MTLQCLGVCPPALTRGHHTAETKRSVSPDDVGNNNNVQSAAAAAAVTRRHVYGEREYAAETAEARASATAPVRWQHWALPDRKRSGSFTCAIARYRSRGGPPSLARANGCRANANNIVVNFSPLRRIYTRAPHVSLRDRVFRRTQSSPNRTLQ